MDKKLGFEDFIAAVAAENQEFVRELHAKLTELGCKMEVKAAKSGFVVSYVLNRKTIANYVFRKKGMIARIYAAHVNEYIEALEDLPGGTGPDRKGRAGLQTDDRSRFLQPQMSHGV